MSGLIACISAFFSAFSQHRDLALENLALRQQLAIFKRRHPRPRLRPTDRLFWVWLSKIWAGWGEALIIVFLRRDRNLTILVATAPADRRTSPDYCRTTETEAH